MSEEDYNRGLRGGNCINWDDQSYKDWYEGHQEYERIRWEKEYKDDVEMDQYFSSEEQFQRRKSRNIQRESYWKELVEKDKESDYKRAKDNISLGTLFLISSIFFFPTLIGGYALRWILSWFGLGFPKYLIWIIAVILVVIVIMESYSKYQREYSDYERKYGKRN